MASLKRNCESLSNSVPKFTIRSRAFAILIDTCVDQPTPGRRRGPGPPTLAQVFHVRWLVASAASLSSSSAQRKLSDARHGNLPSKARLDGRVLIG